MSKRNPILLGFLALLFSLFLFTPVAMASTVKVEALGFFSHPPMQATRNAIQDACKEFGDQVQLTMYDETKADGLKFMQDQGLSGHLPVVLYVDNSVAHKIGDRLVVFRDFEGVGWTEQDLKDVIRLNLAGQKTAVKAPPNATTEAWNPSAIPAQAGNITETNSSGTNTPVTPSTNSGIQTPCTVCPFASTSTPSLFGIPGCILYLLGLLVIVLLIIRFKPWRWMKRG
jgi:hypothetical protein